MSSSTRNRPGSIFFWKSESPKMSSAAALIQPEFREAFRSHERQQRINTGKVASALVFFLMPAGVFLDHFVYPGKTGPFLELRLLCSAFAGFLWYSHTTA